MGRPKGGKNQMHTKEEKMKYVKMILDEGYSVWDLEKKYNVSHSLTNLWVKKIYRIWRKFIRKSEKTWQSFS